MREGESYHPSTPLPPDKEVSKPIELNITPEQVEKELIPALRTWQSIMQDAGIEPLQWFLFGSVVRNRIAPTDDEVIVNTLIPGAIRKHAFREGSDIDVGLVVPDGHDDIDLHLYKEDSPFRTAMVAGHELELTRFELSWLNRRGGLEQLRGENPTLGVYGSIVPIDITSYDQAQTDTTA